MEVAQGLPTAITVASRDPEHAERLQKLRDEGKTIFLNSHLLSEVESVADRVAILQRGKLAALSSVEPSFTKTNSNFG